MKCASQPTQLFPDGYSCPNPAVTYVFGDKYCAECTRRLVELHAEMNPMVASGIIAVDARFL